jgi:hypothetical protein
VPKLPPTAHDMNDRSDADSIFEARARTLAAASARIERHTELVSELP